MLEVTERSVDSVDRIIAEVRRLAALGFRVALDDVGAGNAGLEMLRVLDVDYVKIDRSVVQAAPSDRKALAVLEAIVAFAAGVEATVIAEGIEDAAQLAFVRDLPAAPGAPALV
ncbi:MAG TPA: EAL domain-containing protein, partial [Solirubrobacteraceae bacterium]|nr:EAL domain-containing protein [Solirubrobacteraceae bacterium]